jgi:endonuclease-3
VPIRAEEPRLASSKEVTKTQASSASLHIRLALPVLERSSSVLVRGSERAAQVFGLRSVLSAADLDERSRRGGRFAAVAKPRGAKARAVEVFTRLGEVFPGTSVELCALHHADAFQLLAATILSAQCTDERVNATTPALFARYPGPSDLAAANPEELESIIRSTGFFHAKAQSLIGMARGVDERFGGVVPSQIEELVTLPGVGRKTANVVLSVAFGKPGLPVDTHVGRLAKRLALTVEDDPVKVESDLCSYLPPDAWGALSLRLILHGRATCKARTPDCLHCSLADICPSAGRVATLAVAKAGATARRRPRVSATAEEAD